MKTLGFGERAFQWAQGKGYGAATLRKEVASALPFLPSSDAVVFDIGANHGDWAREMLRQAGARISKLYAFEPSTYNHRRILEISDPRVVLVPKAVSNSSVNAILHYDEPGSGLASLTKRRLDHFGITMGMSEKVAALKLDDFIAENEIRKIHFLKIDIEGHELEALKSADKALSQQAIRALAFEFGGTSIDTRSYFQDFWYFLKERGYTIARINPFFAPVIIDRYSESLETFRVTNFIAYVG